MKVEMCPMCGETHYLKKDFVELTEAVLYRCPTVGRIARKNQKHEN